MKSFVSARNMYMNAQYNLINKEISMVNALLNIYARDG